MEAATSLERGRRGAAGNSVDLTIVVPTFNEKDNVPVLVERLAKSLGDCCSYEVIIVDDNSPDGTAEVAKRLAETRYPFLRVVVREKERGLATAIIEGMRRARGRYIVVMDADLQHPPEKVRELYRVAIETGADVVVASRYARGGGVKGWSRLRLLMSRTASLLAYLLVPESKATTDIMSGFFLVSRRLVEGRLGELRPRGYKILLEIIGRLKPGRIAEVPYVFGERERGESKLGFKTILDYVLHVLDLNEWRVVKNAVVGISGVVVLLATLHLLSDVAGVQALLAYPIALEASIVNNFSWNEAWVFRRRRTGGFRGTVKRFAKYHLAVALGAVTNYTVFALLHGFLGFGKYLSSLAGVAAGWIANYSFSEQVVWRARLARVKH